MKQPMTVYRSPIVTRTVSRQATCADCGVELDRRWFTTTGIPSMVAAAMAEWLKRDMRCLACLRKVARGA